MGGWGKSSRAVTGGGAHLFDGARFDLTRAFTRDRQPSSDLFERMLTPGAKAVAQANDFPLLSLIHI